MNIKSIPMAVLAAAIVVTTQAAVPRVSNTQMTQAANRLVTITYDLADGPAVITLDIETNVTGTAEWVSIGGANIQNIEGDVWKKVETGSHTIRWRPDLSWPDHKIAAGGARAAITAWALDNTPDYMVVDVSSAAQPNTQTYYPSADFVPGGVTNSHYKTSTILMRKIMAKDVTWTMGSVAENGRIALREATHQVTLTNNYYIGVFEVSQTQWQQITGYNPSFFTTENSMRPVEMVSYTDIRQGWGTVSTASSATAGVYPAAPHGESFLGLLRTKTDIDFDLPSEAQWEFAARAGNGEGYWGDGSPIQITSDKDANLDRLSRYLNNPTTNSSTSPAATTAPADGGTAIIGSYVPNAWGLYDMNSNVSEWCLDLHENDITSLNGAVNTSGSNREIRGGAYLVVANKCRAASRGSNPPKSRYDSLGFRLVCTAGLR